MMNERKMMWGEYEKGKNDEVGLINARQKKERKKERIR